MTTIWIEPEDIAVLRKDDLAGVGRIAGIFLLIILLNFGFNFLQKLIMEYTGFRMMNDLRLKLFDHIQHLSMSFFTQNPVGRLVTRVTNDIQNMHELFTSVISLVFKDLFLLVGIAACSDRAPSLAPLDAGAIILAFGDSLTYGTGAEREASYPAVLEQLTGLPVINAGVPGEVTAQGLARLPGLLERHRPALVILCHGGNDMLRRENAEAIYSNLEAMVDLVRAHGAEVLLVGVPQPRLLFLRPAEIYDRLANDRHLVYLRDAGGNSSVLLDSQGPAIEEILTNLQETTRNLREFSRILADRPDALIRGRSAQGRGEEGKK